MRRIVDLHDYLGFSLKALLYEPLWNTVTSRYQFGTNVFEREWDLLVVLDSCRPDVITELAPEYDFLTEPDSIYSVGSYTAEWMIKTFSNPYEDLISDTVFIAGNSWAYRILNRRIHEFNSLRQAKKELSENSDKITTIKPQYEFLYRGIPDWNTVSPNQFAKLEHVWPVQVGENRDSLHPDSPHIPHVVTDRAIDVGRNSNAGRFIVHYSLPHSPFISDALDGRPLAPHESNDYDVAVKNGDATREDVYTSYVGNVRLALEYVETLLENFEAEKAVITADHGEALGELGLYKHAYGVPHPAMKKVPWVETTAKDIGTYEPEYGPIDPDSILQSDVIENMKNLGYIE